jgi:hypothetical protein
VSVIESGVPLESLLAGLEAAPSLIDQAAQAHAEAIVAKAQELGYVHHTHRTIARDGEGVRTITDEGVPMSWLLGRRVPLTGITDANGKPAVRTVTAAALARGGWHYPGREALLRQADESPEVRAVVGEWQRRIIGGNGA